MLWLLGTRHVIAGKRSVDTTPTAQQSLASIEVITQRCIQLSLCSLMVLLYTYDTMNRELLSRWVTSEMMLYVLQQYVSCNVAETAVKFTGVKCTVTEAFCDTLAHVWTRRCFKLLVIAAGVCTMFTRLERSPSPAKSKSSVLKSVSKLAWNKQVQVQVR